jgi:hypothetical protein
MAVSGPTFETKVRRARADINDALGMAPQVPQPMTLPPMGLPPQGMQRQPAAVRPLPVPLQGAYPAGRLPMATPSRAVSPLGMPPQNGALHAAMPQQDVPQRFAKGGGAWTRKEGKNPEGGLNAKGRASLKAQGHDIKPPVSAKLAAKSPKAAARRKSFCARSAGQAKMFPDAARDPDSRLNKARRKWDC